MFKTNMAILNLNGNWGFTSVKLGFLIVCFKGLLIFSSVLAT